MFRRLLAATLVATLGVVAVGCAAGAIARGAAAGALARGAAGSALAARGAAGLATRGAVAGVAGRGALRGALAEITASGRLRPTLLIDRVGRIQHGGRHIATLTADGEILAESGLGGQQLVGRLANGRIWEVNSSGGLEATVGRISGVSVGRGVRLHSGPSPYSTTVEILRPEVAVEVLQIRNGWFEIRLAGGRSGWVWGPLLGITTALALDDDDEQLGDGAGGPVVVSLSTGVTIWAESFRWHNGALEISLPDGRDAMIDDALVRSVEPAASTLDWDWTAKVPKVVFTNGTAVVALGCRLEDGVAVIDLPSGEQLLVDPSLIARADWSA